MYSEVSGNFPNNTQSSIENSFITPLGATLSKTVTQSTTHLITTETDFAKPSAKVKQARGMQLPIVSLDWLEECLAQSTKLAEDSYPLGSTAGSANGNGTSVAGSKKRAASVASDDSQTALQPKKKVASGASKKAAAASQPASQASSSKAPDLKMTVCIIYSQNIIFHFMRK